jgi:hypothetical protein
VLVLFNILLWVMSWVSYRKAIKSNFPISRGPVYELRPDQYG